MKTITEREFVAVLRQHQPAVEAGAKLGLWLDATDQLQVTPLQQPPEGGHLIIEVPLEGKWNLTRDWPWDDILSGPVVVDRGIRGEEHPNWDDRPDSLAERQGAALVAAQAALPYLPGTELARQLAAVLSSAEPAKASQDLLEQLDVAAITPTPEEPAQQPAWKAAAAAVRFALRNGSDPAHTLTPAVAYYADDSIAHYLAAANAAK